MCLRILAASVFGLDARLPPTETQDIHPFRWNEWLTIPNRFSSIPVNSQLAITVWDIQGAVKAVPVGGATMRLFEKSGCVVAGCWTFSVLH